MTVENVDFIDDLVITAPAQTEDPTEGAGHIRVIKEAVKATFSGVTGEVTATQSEINLLDGVTATTAEINKLNGVVLTAEELNQAAGFSGEVRMFGGASAPTGWLLCDGAAISRATYAALFAIVGTVYGVGDGSTTFNLPNFAGRIPMGVGTSSVADATAHVLGEQEGFETHQLTEAELASHTHSVPSSGTKYVDGPTQYYPVSKDINGSSGSTGGDEAHNNLQPSLTITFIIKT